MWRWRLKSFWQPFWRFLVWGDSAFGKGRKVIGLFFFVGLIPAIFKNYSVQLSYLQAPQSPASLIAEINLGLLLAIIVAVVWVLISTGRAYELAGIPELIVANDLVADEVLPSQSFFRLGLMAKGADFDTTVRLIEVLDTSCNRLLPGRFPIELEWSNHPEETSIHLSGDVEESVSVALMRKKNLGDYELIYTGVRHKGEIKLAIGEKAFFHLRIEHRKRKPIERWFWFEKTSNSSFEFESCSKPQAIPSTSTHAE